MQPLTPAVMHVLLSLGGGQKHGYGILKDVLRQSEGRVRLGPGTIYSTLQRLMELGWVEEADAPATVDERRKYYRLTRGGREALHAEVERLEAIVRAARAQTAPRRARS